jgi:hypothetical protein
MVRAETASIRLPPSRDFRGVISPPWLPSVATGVGHNPDSLALVGSAGVDSAQHSPARIIPQRGQVSENSSKPARSEDWGVFHEDVAGSNLANDSGHLSPEAGAGASDAGASAGGGDILTRKAARNHVNNSTPGSPVKGSHVVPDGEGGEAAVVLAGEEDAAGVGVDFDGADSAPPEELAAEYAATCACE